MEIYLFATSAERRVGDEVRPNVRHVKTDRTGRRDATRQPRTGEQLRDAKKGRVVQQLLPSSSSPPLHNMLTPLSYVQAEVETSSFSVPISYVHAEVETSSVFDV